MSNYEINQPKGTDQAPGADKSALLNNLKIDHSSREQAGNTPLVLLLLALSVSVAGGGWFLYGSEAEPIEVQTVIVAAATNSVSANTVLNATGYVTARLQATVSSKITGKVVEVLIEEGDLVEKGQLLARLDGELLEVQLQLGEAQLAASESAILELDVQLRETELNLERVRQLAEKSLASQADLDSATLGVQRMEAILARSHKEIEVSESRLKVQQQQLSDTEIRAPFTGVVINKAAQPGEMISPISGGGGFTRTGIGTLVDMESLEIEVDVNESNINRVSPGQPVTATLNSYQDWEIPAEVITIIPTADRNKATVRVRIKFLTKDDRILPDMGVKVSFMEEISGNTGSDVKVAGVVVPEDAIYASNDNHFVLVVNGEELQQRQVTLGSIISGKRNVIAGLGSGEIVATNITAELAESFLSSKSNIIIRK